MLGKISGILQLLGRVGAAMLGMVVALSYGRFPLAASVGIAQIVFYVSFVVVPLHLKKLLLLTDLDASLSTFGNAVVNLPCGQSQFGAAQVSVVIVDLLRNPEVDKISKITQLQRLIRSRDRQFADAFFHDMIPVLMVVVGTVVFSVAIQKVPPPELLHLGINPQSPVISFAQGLIGIVPVVWALGKLYGEINFIRGRVFELLD